MHDRIRNLNKGMSKSTERYWKVKQKHPILNKRQLADVLTMTTKKKHYTVHHSGAITVKAESLFSNPEVRKNMTKTGAAIKYVTGRSASEREQRKAS